MADITIYGADELVHKISRSVGKDKVNQVIKRNVTQMQTKAMRKAAVDTGAMRRSIYIGLQPMYLSGEVTVGMNYGPYVEYGTRFMDAQPFMRPAHKEQRRIFLNDLRNLIRKG